jgi:hypothetical protein
LQPLMLPAILPSSLSERPLPLSYTYVGMRCATVLAAQYIMLPPQRPAACWEHACAAQ